MIDNVVKLTSQIEIFCSADENNGRRRRDEYMNAAAAHASFVMTVSAARMYWLLRHIQKLHPLPEKNRFGLDRFSAQWNATFRHTSSTVYATFRS